jgi:hypothetical protein
MKIGNGADFGAGVLFIAAGLFFALFAQSYELGSAQRMGPAYFPTVLGAALALIGALIALRGWVGPRTTSTAGAAEPTRIGPLLWVLGAVAAFGLLLRPLGLVVALAMLVGLASRASGDLRRGETVAVGLALVALVPIVFIWGLGLTLPLWPAFVAR